MGSHIKLTEPFVAKLECMSYDIKYYVNANVSLSSEDQLLFDKLSDADVEELIDIRKRIKKLHYDLKQRLKEN